MHLTEREKCQCVECERLLLLYLDMFQVITEKKKFKLCSFIP